MKKVLLIMTDFYNYNQELIKEMQHKGYEVCSFLDRIELGFSERIIAKLDKNIGQRKYDSYFDAKIKEYKNEKFDKILIVFGAVYLKKYHIEKLREAFSGTPIVYYAWDSVRNFKSIKVLFDNADVAYTFDQEDATKYDVNFLPLFYLEKGEEKNTTYDVSTVMTFFAEKSDNLDKVLELLPEKLNKFIYLKIKNKAYLYRLKLKNRNLIKKYGRYFQYEKLSKAEVRDIILKSKAVLDCPLSNQNGLTIRTFEALALKKKLITTNRNIKKYDFYNSDNIYVVGEDQRDISKFINSDFNSEYALGEDYSLKNFIDKLLR